MCAIEAPHYISSILFIYNHYNISYSLLFDMASRADRYICDYRSKNYAERVFDCIQFILSMRNRKDGPVTKENYVYKSLYCFCDERSRSTGGVLVRILFFRFFLIMPFSYIVNVQAALISHRIRKITRDIKILLYLLYFSQFKYDVSRRALSHHKVHAQSQTLWSSNGQFYSLSLYKPEGQVPSMGNVYFLVLVIRSVRTTLLIKFDNYLPYIYL